MSYLPEDMPAPAPTLDTEEWWESCRRRELRFQKCRDCGTLRHPPSPLCPSCHSLAYDWHPSAGRGRVYSFTWVHHVFLPGLEGRVPYNVAVIVLDDAPGIRLVSNVLDVTPAALHIDLPVRLVWEAAGPFTLPRFQVGTLVRSVT
ncbi:MAG: Zn-ribbon domain-containing OB-fold protein [Candidatus Binatia bacterium]